MSIELSPSEPDASAGKLTNLLRIGRSQAAYGHVPEMWWMLAAQFAALIALFVVVVVI